MPAIVLFDGSCHICDRSVQFILKRDPGGHFQFASLQGEAGNRLLAQYGIAPDIGSLVLIEDGACYFKSSAALRICKSLRGGWKWLSVLAIIPRPIRDALYDLVARNRYRWFGQKNSCSLPSPEVRERFLD